jgi:hypothetical protein
MSGFERVDEYDSVDTATTDILKRIEQLPETENWLSNDLYQSLIPDWSNALIGFEANAAVSKEQSIYLNQIEKLYDFSRTQLEKQSTIIGSGKMKTLEPSHVLFIVLFRDLQHRTDSKVNMNPHKLRVLLDGRYTVE